MSTRGARPAASRILRGLLPEFQMVGRELAQGGLVTSHGGNLSVRLGESTFITRGGAMLGHLEEADLVEVAAAAADYRDELASVELPVHRQVYQSTGHCAVIHAHPPHAVAFSLRLELFVPPDVEGAYHLKQVPVLAVDQPSASRELAEAAATTLLRHRVLLVRGHGCFAAAKGLLEALHLVTVLEESCRIAFLERSLGSLGKGL